jgi:hypothetical protein
VSGLQGKPEDSGFGSCDLDQVDTILLEWTQEPDSETSLARFKTLRTDIWKQGQYFLKIKLNF